MLEVSMFIFGPSAATFFLGIITIWFLYWYSTRKHSYWKDKGIPFVKPYPVLGTFHELMMKPFHEVELSRYFKYGKIYGNYELNDIVLSVADPILLRDILVKDFQYFSSKRNIILSDEIFSNMLVMARGENWKRIRAIVTPTFTTGKIKKTLSIFKDCALTAVKNFKIHAEKGEPVEVKRLFGCYTMDVIASSAFSTKIDSHGDPDNEFVKQAKKAFPKSITLKSIGFIIFPRLMSYFKVSLMETSSKDFFCGMINEIIKERKKTGQTRNDFLQLLLDTAKELDEDERLDIAGNESKDIAENYGKVDAIATAMKSNISKKHLSFNELVAQCMSFFLAGYDTTSSVLSFATYFLALNQDAQDRARAEVDKVIDDNDGELTYEAIQSMKYLDNVISETLRIYPPNPRFERAADKYYELGDTGITLDKGVVVTIPIYAIHRDPEYYPDPEKFDPDRFSAEERAKRNPYTYLPFALGPRNCVAMRFALLQIKVCLAYVISNFVVKTCPQTKIPPEFDGFGVLQARNVTVEIELRRVRSLVK